MTGDDYPEPVVLFVATRMNIGVQQFMKTMNHARQTYIHIGLGAKWGGWRWRAEQYIKTLCGFKCDTWVATSDADDVICARALSASQLSRRILVGQILASAEIFCGSNCVSVEPYWRANECRRPKGSIFTHPNAGGLAGRAQDLIDFYTWFLDSKLTDDQIALGKYCNQFPNRVVVDVEGNDMCVVGPLYSKSFRKVDGKIIIDHNKRVSEPAIVHFSGEAADVLKLTYTSGNGKDGIPKEALAKLILADDFVAQDPTFPRVV